MLFEKGNWHAKMQNENKQTNKILLQALNGEQTEQVPFWLMRQAGRYLPEYRELRAKREGFLNLVYHPESASEVTIQPIRRFGMDGAILFSDILVTPQAMGQDLRFETCEGPRLNPIQTTEDLKKLSIENLDETLSPIYDTVSLTRQKLDQEGFTGTALIGFAGSPWTVACYMVNGKGSKDYQAVKNYAKANPDDFSELLNLLVQATIHYLSKQIDAGAEAIQLFDSWSGLLNDEEFEEFVIGPTMKIVSAIKSKYPSIPVIGFPRKAGSKIAKYALDTKIDALGLDEEANLDWILDNIPDHVTLQGNLSNEHLLQGGEIMQKAAKDILDKCSKRPFIFNLGHGVIKETPVDHVGALTDIIRNYK